MALRRTRVRESYIEVEYTDIDEEQLWEPGHLIYDWCADITLTLEAEAKQTAPGFPGTSHARWPRRSSGKLRAGIVALGKRTGPESYDIILESQAPYTMWVHGGTAYQRGQYIYSHAGYVNRAFIDANLASWHEGDLIQTGRNAGDPSGEGKFSILPIHGNMFMVLPPGGGHSRRFHLRVRGQLPNAFLYRAWDRTNELPQHHGQLGSMVPSLGFVAPPGVGKGRPA